MVFQFSIYHFYYNWQTVLQKYLIEVLSMNLFKRNEQHIKFDYNFFFHFKFAFGGCCTLITKPQFTISPSI